MVSQLFKIRTSEDDDKILSIFDVIFRTYANVTGEGLNYSSLSSLIDLWKEIVKRLNELCWNQVQLSIDYKNLSNEIKRYYSNLDDSVLNVLAESSIDKEDEYLAKVYEKLQSVKEISKPYVNNEADVDFSNLVSQNSCQFINQIIELCQNWIGYC